MLTRVFRVYLSFFSGIRVLCNGAQEKRRPQDIAQYHKFAQQHKFNFYSNQSHLFLQTTYVSTREKNCFANCILFCPVFFFLLSRIRNCPSWSVYFFRSPQLRFDPSLPRKCLNGSLCFSMMWWWRWWLGRAKCFGFFLKGKFPQTTMWIGWVESKFTNPTVKVWADFDNPFKRSDYAKLCMSPSLYGTLPELCDITRGQLSIDFVHRFSQFFVFSWISIVLLIMFIHKCMHIHLSPITYLSIKEEGRYIFMKS